MAAVPALRSEPAANRPASLPLPTSAGDGFDFAGLRVFTEIPRHHYDVAVLEGMVVVYDHECIGREGVQEGGFYVREHQHPYAGMSWENWLDAELRDRTPRCQPRGRLKVQREVVQAFRCARTNNWALRLASGFVDGPYYDWAFGADLVGKVVGLYLPGKEAQA
jgi:hypothetical protein